MGTGNNSKKLKIIINVDKKQTPSFRIAPQGPKWYTTILALYTHKCYNLKGPEGLLGQVP